MLCMTTAVLLLECWHDCHQYCAKYFVASAVTLCIIVFLCDVNLYNDITALLYRVDMQF